MKVPIQQAKVLVVCALLLVCSTAKAQKNQKDLIKNAFLTTIQIDGLATEWAETHFASDKISGISYAFANNDSTLFVVLKTANKESIAKMIHWGLSLGFNSKGQKKVQERVVFPAGKPQDKRFDPVLGRGKRPGFKEEVAQLNSITLLGFANIIDGPIALKNDFGIYAIAQFNNMEELVCEYALPMKLLQTDGTKSDIFACQIKLYGLNVTPNPSVANRNFELRGNPNGPMQTNSLLDSTEFWVLYPLASK